MYNIIPHLSFITTIDGFIKGLESMQAMVTQPLLYLHEPCQSVQGRLNDMN